MHKLKNKFIYEHFQKIIAEQKGRKTYFPGRAECWTRYRWSRLFVAIPAVLVFLLCAPGKELPLLRLRSSRRLGSGLRRPENSRTRPRNETLTNHSSDVVCVAVRAAYLANERWRQKLVAVEGTWTYDLLILAVRACVEGQGTFDPRCVCMISGQ